MKIVSSKQMAEIEANAYKDGASESEFMEEAGSGAALVIHDFVELNHLSKQAVLLCAKGNNSGDAYVAGVDLLHLDYNVIALQVTSIDEASPLCKQNYARFLQEGGIVHEIDSPQQIIFPLNGVFVDALFGTGLHGPLREPFASIVEAVNRSNVPVISIDIPSGLNGENGLVESVAIRAAETAFLGLPKLGFFLNEGWNHVGKLRHVDFGLEEKYIETVDSSYILLTTELLKGRLPSLVPNRHKYQAGYVVGVAGSPGMAGAAVLSSWSALCGGAGMMRLMHPPEMVQELTAAPYEIIKTSYKTAEDILKECERASALFIGPGIGTDSRAEKLVSTILKEIKIPCVIDADALSIIGKNKLTIPEKAILTPHRGEMGRLLGEKLPLDNDMKVLDICKEYAYDHATTLILKGGPSLIFHPEGPVYINSLGSPGMATAGSGDVLTGLAAAMLAQGSSPLNSSILSVYIHAFAGECAAFEHTPYCMTATDIIEHFTEAFHALTDMRI